jgi:hypothetical protein
MPGVVVGAFRAEGTSSVTAFRGASFSSGEATKLQSRPLSSGEGGTIAGRDGG